MQSVKCVLVGDSEVGKTCLLSTYVRKVFPQGYLQTFHDQYSTKVIVDNHSVSLNLWDTSGRDEYERLRGISYYEANVILICFSVANPTSYESVKDKWLPEVKHHCPDVPVLLVGTMTDLRDDEQILETLKQQNQTTVTQQQGTVMAKQIKAVRYLECASINQDGLDEVFVEAVRAFLRHSALAKKPCVLL